MNDQKFNIQIMLTLEMITSLRRQGDICVKATCVHKGPK